MRSSQYFDHVPPAPRNEFQQLLAGNTSPPSPHSEEDPFPLCREKDTASMNVDELDLDDGEMPSMLSQSVLLPLPKPATSKHPLREMSSVDETCQAVSNVNRVVRQHSSSRRVSAIRPGEDVAVERADLREFEALEEALRKETVDAEEDEASFYKKASTAFQLLPAALQLEHASATAVEEETEADAQMPPPPPPMSGLVKRMFQPKRQRVGRENVKRVEAVATKASVKTGGGVGDTEAGLRKKMEELEREIVEYQAASKELELQKKKVYDSMRKFEKMQSEIKRQQQEFARVHKEKREEFEAWMEEEAKKLRKERGHLERQKQRLLLERTEGVKDRKGRAEIESLKATLARLRAEKDATSGRMKGTVKAKDERIHCLEAQVAELEKALAVAEERRVDAWDKQIQLEAELVESQRSYEIIQGKLHKAEQRLEDQTAVTPKAKAAHPPVSPMSKAAPNKELKARVIKYKNGTVKKVYPDGTVSINFSNGDMSTEKPNGESTYHYKGDNIMHTTYPDGTQHIRFPDGQVEIVHEDGSREILRSND